MRYILRGLALVLAAVFASEAPAQNLQGGPAPQTAQERDALPCGALSTATHLDTSDSRGDRQGPGSDISRALATVPGNMAALRAFSPISKAEIAADNGRRDANSTDAGRSATPANAAASSGATVGMQRDALRSLHQRPLDAGLAVLPTPDPLTKTTT